MISRLKILAALAPCLAAATCAVNAPTITAISNATCYLAQDGATVTAIVRPGAAPLANAGAAVACSASSQVGAAVIAANGS